jgi:hypothetical protein
LLTPSYWLRTAHVHARSSQPLPTRPPIPAPVDRVIHAIEAAIRTEVAMARCFFGSQPGSRPAHAAAAPLPTALSNGQTPLGMSNTNAIKQLRGARNTKIGPCAARALPHLGNLALKVVKMGTKHAQMGRSMAHIACSPTWPSVFGRRCEPLAGLVLGVVGLGWSCSSAHRWRVGRFFNPSA